MTLTPAALRLDLKCGGGAISEGEKCTKGAATKAEKPNSVRKALAVGLTVTALGAGAYALSRRGPRSAGGASAGTSRPITPPGPPRLPGITPKALLKPAPPRQSKTQRMRENTVAAIRNAEARIAQTAREETRRLAQIGNTMAAAGEAAGMATKLTARNVRLRVEAARRKYEPGYRAPQPRRLPGGIQAQLPQQSTPPEREAIPINPRTGQPRRRKARGFGRTDNFIQHYAPVQLQPPTRRDTEDGKKYTKVVTNPETGRKNRIRYGAKGYKIAPGTERGNNYCTRSFGDMKSHGKDCAGADRNTPLCLSRAKWRCSGKVSRRA